MSTIFLPILKIKNYQFLQLQQVSLPESLENFSVLCYSIKKEERRSDYAFTGIRRNVFGNDFDFIKKSSAVRAIDVGEYMNFSKPSVSRAMGLLKSGSYITVDKDGFISLTDSGRSIAEKIYERHTLLTAFLVKLGVDEKTAAEDACKIEHDISDASFEAIKNHAQNK